MLSEFFRDLQFGVRLLRRSPGFTFIAVLSLGLGIGGATAVFSLVNAIVLRTLPVPDPQELGDRTIGHHALGTEHCPSQLIPVEGQGNCAANPVVGQNRVRP